MTSATDELRRLLDELRKLACDINEKEIRSHGVITLNQGRYNRQFRLDINHDWLNAWHAELERILQAVEATLGRGDVEWDGDVLVLTLPRDPSSIHVRRADGEPRKVYPSEATLGRGTCHIMTCDNLNELGGDVWLECDACHWQMDYAEAPSMPLNFCPNCGREVVE